MKEKALFISLALGLTIFALPQLASGADVASPAVILSDTGVADANDALKNASKLMHSGDIAGGKSAISEYLQSPSAKKLDNQQLGVFYQRLSKLLITVDRKADSDAAWAQAVIYFSKVSTDVPQVEIKDLKDLQEKSAETAKPLLEIAQAKLDSNSTIVLSPDKGAADDLKNKLLQDAQKKLNDELIKKLGTGKIKQLQEHVISSGTNGKISSKALIESSPAQLDEIFRKIEQSATLWKSSGKQSPVDIVIYAHGGLTSEAQAMLTASTQLDWWKANHVYPIFLAWQSGMEEMLSENDGWTVVKEATSPQSLITLAYLKAREISNATADECDQLLEDYASRSIRQLWTDMKVKSLTLFSSEDANSKIDWKSPLLVSSDIPAGILLVSRLEELSKRRPVRIHLVGHSAGSILLTALIDHLAYKKIPIESVSLLAPAITVTEFEARYKPHWEKQDFKRLSIYNLSEENEKTDPNTRVSIFKYHKSLLYLVSRALEPQDAFSKSAEVPLLGMAKCFKNKSYIGAPTDLLTEIKSNKGRLILSPPPASNKALCNADSHGGFGVEPATLDSVLSDIKQSDAIKKFTSIK